MVDEQLHVLPWYRPLNPDGLEVRLVGGGKEGRDMGGMAFALPHGSLLLEVAKHEVHATTALRHPDRRQPTRIGMVFYTQAGLHIPDHGKKACEEEERSAFFNKYLTWLRGTFVPTTGEIKTLSRHGYAFPENVRTKPTSEKMRKRIDEALIFRQTDFPFFQPGKEVEGVFRPIRSDDTCESFFAGL